ncbi:MAG: hypothetical protein E6446_05090 [Gemella haemolysans]|nr:hypothetical protein [Gemella haemolysans]
MGFGGYLGDLKYYDGDKTHTNRSEIKDSDFKDTTIIENYSKNEKDAFIDVYKKKFPGRTVYPKTLSYNVDKNKIDVNNELETFTQVFVPVMESIFPGAGTQRMTLKYDLSSLTTKTITVPKVDREKLAKEKAEKERIEAERLAKEKAEKEHIEIERLAKEKAEKERIEIERLAKEKAEKERIEREKAPVTAKGEAAILEKTEFDLEGYLREQKQLTEETTTTSNKKPLINDIFGQSEVKDTFVAIPVSTKESNATTTNVKKPLANTGISTSSTAFFGLASLFAVFILRRKFNK